MNSDETGITDLEGTTRKRRFGERDELDHAVEPMC
jgi:hypothetical protein